MDEIRVSQLPGARVLQGPSVLDNAASRLTRKWLSARLSRQCRVITVAQQGNWHGNQYDTVGEVELENEIERHHRSRPPVPIISDEVATGTRGSATKKEDVPHEMRKAAAPAASKCAAQILGRSLQTAVPRSRRSMSDDMCDAKSNRGPVTLCRVQTRWHMNVAGILHCTKKGGEFGPVVAAR